MKEKGFPLYRSYIIVLLTFWNEIEAGLAGVVTRRRHSTQWPF